MAVTVEYAEGGLCRIAVDGEMTIYTALALKDELLSPLAQCETLEINLAGVSEIDSAGLQLLIVVKTAAKARGKNCASPVTARRCWTYWTGATWKAFLATTS